MEQTDMVGVKTVDEDGSVFSKWDYPRLEVYTFVGSHF